MSMSTFVNGFRPPDEKWAKMKEAWDACEAAGVDPPEAVSDFFGGEPPDEAGVVVKIDGAVRKYNSSSSSGYEIDLIKLPKDVRIIRFSNSW